MSRHAHFRKSVGQRGFSFLELLMVLLILGILSGTILVQVSSVQQRSRTEQVKLDNFQEARDFIDQFFRDISQIGYPNLRMFDTSSWSPALSSTPVNDNRLAVGLVKVAATEVRFEGDVAGNGIVDSVVYMVNGSGTCPLCLQRSQTNKASGDPLTGQTQSWGTEVNDVLNSVIFSAYRADGSKVTLPVDITNNPTDIASIKTIQISLQIRNNSITDPQTHQPIETNIGGEVSINNCSMAASGQPESCQ